MITKCSTVSLIGISWGGAVCILMAQMLEADNIAVSLTLLDGLPNVFQEWTSSLRQYGNFNSKLVSNYFQSSRVVSKALATESGWNTELPKILSSNNIANADKTLTALNAIRSRLNAIVLMKPKVNKIFAKVIVINRSINIDTPHAQNLTDYCISIPEKYIIDAKDYEEMLSKKKVIQIINNNILHYHPDSIDVSIKDLYARFERDSTDYNID